MLVVVLVLTKKVFHKALQYLLVEEIQIKPIINNQIGFLAYLVL